MSGRHFAPGARVGVLTRQPLDRVLDYRAPTDGVRDGAFVEVPLGPRLVLGVVWGEGTDDVDPAKLKTIERVLDLAPMPQEMRSFLARVADYTLTPLPAVLRLATRAPSLAQPPRPRRLLQLGQGRPARMTPARERVLEVLEARPERRFTPGELAGEAGVGASVLAGLITAGAIVETVSARDRPYPRLDPARPGPTLTAEQAEAAATLRTAVAARAYATTLLKGVTGSGKTEVYLEAVAEALSAGRQALVLLPEIALTAQFLERVEERFGARPVEWHSGVTEAGRRRAWRAVAAGEAQLVVGARSALFLPFPDLALIVVDEEHDTAYKQEDGALYHARDMAVLRASLSGSAVVLASATPSLETWANADTGKYARLALSERFGPAQLPEMQAIDLRSAGPERGGWIAPAMVQAVAERIRRGEQALLFLNRRGYAPLTVCRACGHQIGCYQCDARMVEHRFRGQLLCHQCGDTQPIPTACPACGREDSLAVLGPGVERLAEEVAARFPDARAALLSSDLAEGPEGLKARIAEIAAGGADIIIGTQIVAKGHNFPNLTLVGVIDADLGLMGGDLRAAERTFQLVRQVAGRAGRADRPGLALIQTHQPEHPVIRAILDGDEESFWRAEAAKRQEAGMPPYGRMAGVLVSGPEERTTFEIAGALARQAPMFRAIGAELFGPAPAPIARIRGRVRVRLLIKAPKGVSLQPTLRTWRTSVRLPTGYRVAIDIDPQSFF
ncbi:MAG: primosomal protein N' [Pseudomonadota bacterium]